MNQLIKVRLKTILRTIAIKDFRSLIRFASYIFVISIFLYGNYIVFFKIFSFLLKQEEIGRGIVYRISSLMFSTFFFMLFASSVISSLTTFFRTDELEFLFTTPINSMKLFTVKLFENGIYSSWATMIISVPLVLAIGKAFEQKAIFYFAALTLFFIMISIAVVSGLFVVFLLSNFFKKHSVGSVVFLLAILTLSLSAVIFFVKAPDLLNLPRTININEINRYVFSLEVEQFKYIPSGIVLQIMFNIIDHSGFDGKLLFFLGLYMVFSAAFLFISMFVYEKKYLAFEKTASSSSSKKRNNMEFPLFFKNSKEILVIQKDLAVFFRDPSQWGQSLIFIILLIFYGVSIARSPIYFKTPFYTYILAFANLGFSSYIMATLSVRFMFPLISLEGNAISLVKSCMNIKNYLNAKIIFNFFIILSLGEFLVAGTNGFLFIDMTVIFVSMIIVLILSFGITIINTAFGAILPDFKEKNPSKIASGFGGIVSAIASMAYIGLSMAVLSGPTRMYFEFTFSGKKFNNIYFFYSVLIVLAITLIMFFVLYPMAVRVLRKREF